MKCWFLLALLVGWAGTAAAETVFTHRAPETDNDTRHRYETGLLRLALEKTVDEYGPFQLKAAPAMNIARTIHSMRHQTYPNHFFGLSYGEDPSDSPELTYVRFPMDLGILGIRTCFIPETMREKVANITTLEQLRKLTIGQGRGWMDNIILRHNGFEVIEIEDYEALFRMTAAHRFDLFCRGATEIKREYDLWGDIEGLAYDRSIVIHYPMPRFLYTNKANVEAIERVTKGLHKAYADGSIRALWQDEFAESVDFAGLDERRVFRLKNPMTDSIDFDFDHDRYSHQFAPKKPDAK